MVTLRPFRAYRPVPELAAEVAARPYDVLSTEEARQEAAGNPLSFLRVGKPEIDFPQGTDPHAGGIYLRAKENLGRLITMNVLVRDPEPCLYVYALTMGHHRQCGVVGCVAVEEYQQGRIVRHELTRPDKEDDRTRHILVTGAHTGPILMTHRAVEDVDVVVREISAGKAAYDFEAVDGVRHQLWVVRDGMTIRRLTALFGTVPYLYIADGHHRTAAAARAATECRRRNPAHDGSEEYNFFLAVLFPHTQLQIFEYNRLVRTLNGLTRDRFLKLLRTSFSVERTPGSVRPMRKGEFGLYLDGSWYIVTCTDSLPEEVDPVRQLDVSILQNHVLGPLLGIDDPRTNSRIDFVGGIRGAEELERRVNSGEMAAAFSLYPTSIEELLTIADAGLIMPPKSTWFEPKLRDGLLTHMLEEEQR